MTITAYDDVGAELTMSSPSYSIESEGVRLIRGLPDRVPFNLSPSFSGGKGVIAFDTSVLKFGNYRGDAKITYPSGEVVYAGPWLFDVIDPVTD